MNPSSFVTTTEAVDTAFYVIFGISAASLLGVILAMIYFVWRYNRKRQPQPISQKDHNIWLEIIWTIIPTILVMVMFWYGWEGYLSLRRIPDNAMPVTGSARMWSWLFTYENGKTDGKLYVPVGQPVKVKLIAEDVLHSFYVPAFRVKRDTVPGMPTYVWFVADKPGSYHLFCAEYCGAGHADMITTVEALPPEEFAAWLKASPAAEEAGLALLQEHGCIGCHSLDGSRSIGPTLQGIAGREVVVMTDNEQRTLSSDRDYLRRSILEPGVDLVTGYPPVMPPYADRIPADDLAEILDYLMSLTGEDAVREQTTEPTAADRQPAPAVALPADDDDGSADVAADKETPAMAEEAVAPAGSAEDLAAAGAALAEQSGCLGCHSLDGSRSIGPSLLNLAGSERTVTRDGQVMSLIADRDYLERAILDPAAEVTEGYMPAMPPYAHLSPAEVKALIAWLESLQ